MCKPHKGWRAWWVALATCLLQLTAVAQSLTTDEACRIGRQWLSVQYPQPVVRRGEDGVDAVRWRAVYRVQRGDGAFVLLHARTAAVMGYGCSGLRPMPEALHTALMQYGDLNGVVAGAEARASYPVVPPLLQSVRGQSAPYNLSCPYYTTEEGTSTQRCLTGCVATALEQILTYYRQPAQLQDSLARMETPHYVVEGVPAGTLVDWAHVRDIYAEGAYSEAEARAVADLSLWCGMMAGMNWGLETSGAQIRPLEAAARREASEQLAEKQKEQLLADAQRQADAIVAEGKAAAEAERASKLRQADAQIADLTRTVCAKVLERNLTQQDDARLLDDLLQKAGDSDGKRS